MVRALVCGTRGRWFESTLLYQKMTKEKNSKPSKDLPLGFVDRQEKELLVRDFIISNIKEVMIKYGFQYLETPSFEYSDSIGKFLPDKDRPDEGVFSFKDENKWLSLRYDLTAPLARYVAKNYLEIPKPFKRYQLGTVWRNEKPGPGRFREFLQFDADYVGTKSLQADAELCVMISEILKKCGLSKSEYIIKISSRKITEELFKKININLSLFSLISSPNPNIFSNISNRGHHRPRGSKNNSFRKPPRKVVMMMIVDHFFADEDYPIDDHCLHIQIGKSAFKDNLPDVSWMDDTARDAAAAGSSPQGREGGTTNKQEYAPPTVRARTRSRRPVALTTPFAVVGRRWSVRRNRHARTARTGSNQD